MDNSLNSSPRASWATPRPAAFTLVGGGVLLFVAAFFAASDPAGLVLMGVAALLLFGVGIVALTMRPRLAVTQQGELIVRSLTGRRVYPRDRIDRIRLLELRRIGRRAGQLQIDVLRDDAPATTPDALREDTRLIVFSRWDLGADVGEVADELRRAGFDVEDARRLS
ncbi:PH domain-containing protein [Gordonia sp. CPCC 205515]|uniref:PH domain-containing protein n=1 Tax=Gordonia sp. CPCC 205515 TaxID=3140791 RepID=UPI003AF34597